MPFNRAATAQPDNGDFQMTKEEMADIGLLSATKLDVLSDDSVTTCFSSKTARAIDHCLISRSISFLFSVFVVFRIIKYGQWA